MTQTDIGVVGLVVMGQNLARNIASRGTRVAVYNRTFARTEALINERPDLLPAADLPSFHSEWAAS